MRAVLGGSEILVLVKLLTAGADVDPELVDDDNGPIDMTSLTFRRLGKSIGMDPGSANRAVVRLVGVGLCGQADRWHVPRRENAAEFLVHGAKYVFPPAIDIAGGPDVRGLLTGHWASPLDAEFATAAGSPAVWPHAQGDARGLGLTPIDKRVPTAAMTDPSLREIFALIDALRLPSSGTRVRKAAGRLLKERILGG